jgi:hypothetical protein
MGWLSIHHPQMPRPWNPRRASPYGRNILQDNQDETANVTHHGAADITVPLRDPLAKPRPRTIAGD